MGRKKKNKDEKNISFGITLEPKMLKLLEEQSKKENITISKLIQNVMKEYIKKNPNMND